jgi:hypothetical protein
MTTEVIIVNLGPDPVLVRTVQYADEAKGYYGPHSVVEDLLVNVHDSKKFWVHRHQQLLVGERIINPDETKLTASDSAPHVDA